MEYRIETWTLQDLLDKYNNKTLDLNPSYQRRFIWSLNDQQTLINSIINGYAIPNLFLLEKEKDNFEMVDGQQRSRTILGFVNQQFKTFDKQLYSNEAFGFLMNYKIAVIIIEKINAGENIEEFYALVNKAGVHLNRPELKKAEYFETNFLKLVTTLAESEKFTKLELFTDATAKRMVDIDLVSELVTLLVMGNTDKKNAVDKKFEEDITQQQYNEYETLFNNVLDILVSFNDKYPIKKTRYKQRNDFYTLFGFINQSAITDSKILNYFYALLLKFNDHIAPSNTKCPPFQNYSFHCISQSNSKNARDERLKILNQIFLNKKETPNKAQKDILKYFELEPNAKSLIQLDDIYTINIVNL
jgi:hypothetical protein